MLLTILTPTYNRAGMLPQLYNSLKKQACKDFEWVIVDDGSTDNTQEVVKAWLLGSDFPIRFLRSSLPSTRRMPAADEPSARVVTRSPSRPAPLVSAPEN